ncbi:uncharacterized protein P884DRAFT_270349 [Thermothelomyces heterothallicus CBS 202.75]|uniref:uncharacterized protein n=1 Tax=Thermothelomyces heterothallicus CBS 202.75 TaxID=1149848 RepID=UPI0037432E7E
MAEAGADVTILCSNGYIALEQAIFSGNSKSENKLRPILYKRVGGADCVKRLRRAYAGALAADTEKSALSGRLNSAAYRGPEGLVRSFQLEKPGEENELGGVLIFSSYCWLNQDRSLNTPEDPARTQC